MEMCDTCRAIQLSKRGADGHAGLIPIGEPRSVKMGIGQAKARVSDFECNVCDTRWTYTDDRNDDHEGWSLSRHA